MATARELLEQADALMRRNRPQEAGPDAASDIPVLTEVVAEGDALRVQAPTASPGAEVPHPPSGEIPVLTEVVEDFEPISIIEEPVVDDGQWPDFDDGAITVTQAVWEASPGGPAAPASASPPDASPPAAPDAEAASVETATTADAGTDAEAAPHAAEAAPPVAEDAALAPGTRSPPSAAGSGAAPGVRGPGDAESERWDTLAEEIRMQVMQRIDIFTDTGLQEQLSERLQPIVDRASADLVATINQHVGQLLRAYVAEAIEREIERWRQDGAGD